MHGLASVQLQLPASWMDIRLVSHDMLRLLYLPPLAVPGLCSLLRVTHAQTGVRHCIAGGVLLERALAAPWSSCSGPPLPICSG